MGQDEIIRIQAEHIGKLTDDLRHSRMMTQRYRNQLNEAYDMLVDQKVLLNALTQERGIKYAVVNLCRGILSNIHVASDRVYRWVTR